MVVLDIQKVDNTAKLDARTPFDLVKLSFGVVAGAGALVALVVAYRRQRVDEAGAHREATRLHTERFSQAVDKLGPESPAVRLGGVHALAGLADDAPDDSLRQTCIDVLCAYLQLPFLPDPGGADEEGHHRYLALRKVRHTILHLIAAHYRRPQGTHRSLQGHDLDLTGVTMDAEISFTGAVFSEGSVDFSGAVFSDGAVDFTGALFSGCYVYFLGASFTGSQVGFRGAVFSGGRVDFSLALFSSGHLTFANAAFSGSSVHFSRAAFSESTLAVNGATFSSGTVTFNSAAFSDGVLDFSGAAFSGSDVDFSSASFSDMAVICGSATGSAPYGLLTAVGNPIPGAVTVPSAWTLPDP
ncbi:pentapeptide repeat-containing protein [Streptomyces sp. NPDC059556]|uniref:pentapeptide repeat-containing protein n=1 Tax=Streptomyces sp. NPDC059556 TaxID=3346863 RepID=UPI00367BE999